MKGERLGDETRRLALAAPEAAVRCHLGLETRDRVEGEVGTITMGQRGKVAICKAESCGGLWICDRNRQCYALLSCSRPALLSQPSASSNIHMYTSSFAESVTASNNRNETYWRRRSTARGRSQWRKDRLCAPPKQSITCRPPSAAAEDTRRGSAVSFASHNTHAQPAFRAIVIHAILHHRHGFLGFLVSLKPKRTLTGSRGWS